MKKSPPLIRISSFRRPKTVNYLDGFWKQLLRDTIKGLSNFIRRQDYRSLKGRFSFIKTPKLRWEHVVIAFLLGLLVMKGAGPVHIVRNVSLTNARGVSPAPAFITIKPLPLLKEPSQKPVSVLEAVWVSKLRPPDTYPNSYSPGQCTFGIASRLPIPNDWGNANNWAYAASIAGYTVTNVPTVEAIAQTGGDSYLGHVALVIGLNPDGSFVIWEENGAGGPFTTDERTTTTAEFPNFIKI